MDTMEHYSATRKGEILPFAATRMDLGGITPSDRGGQIRNVLSCMWNLKKEKPNS